ncbi:MAG: hypothetical protein ACOC7U_04215, partial [Spirochaetota bacterium]
RQSLRSDEFHFLRNLHDGTEEWYDPVKDPGEKRNIIAQVKGPLRKKLLDLRKIMNDMILKGSTSNKEWSDEEKNRIQQRLRRLGYTG